MRLKVGVPFAKHGRITDETLGSLRALSQCRDIETEIITQQGSNVPRARNAMINGDQSNLIRQTLPDFDYFLCVDADTAFTVDNVRQLMAHDLDIVSGSYTHKHMPELLVAGWFDEVEGVSPREKRVPLEQAGLLEVDWVGAGFLLLKKDVLEHTPYPWFTSMEVEYPSDEGPCSQVVSEDFGFCMKMRRNGKKIMLDADCRVDHVPHPNEMTTPGAMLSNALNDLLRNRDIIIRHIKAMDRENTKLKEMLKKTSGSND
ncbi:glycosyltransferase family A protein [uncultured Pseudodesulfovibrio sp.]|uniref:glycosyltransferase family A protein n=1 Tax=uncultured Pseudodesulfovibrio sp. TaxID=2035858 RepID=UPI0029C6226F|nr:glycosyltransferase family A protein [uncultured Pseudodesulfovibrio sp.]